MQTEIEFIINEIKHAGFDARIVGGYVRDFVLGNPSSDIDIATTATPDNILRIFNNLDCKVIPTGIKHGTITVVKNSIPFEITTLRTDDTTDGRHAEVSFSDSWEKDASRRDFTFNALYMDLDGKIYDFFDGIKDLKNGIIRFIGNPEKRICEDFLRILRFFRFSVKLNIKPDSDEIFTLFKKYAPHLSQLSRERIRHEFHSMLRYNNSFGTLLLMDNCDVLNYGAKINIEQFKKLSQIYASHPGIINTFFNSLENFISKIFLLFKPETLCKDLCLTKIEKKDLKFLESQVEFQNVSDKENLLRNVLFHENKLIFEKLSILIFQRFFLDNFNQNNISEYVNLARYLNLLKSKYSKNQRPLFPVTSSDIIELPIKQNNISKALLLTKKFWSENFGNPSKSECLEFLVRNLSKI